MRLAEKMEEEVWTTAKEELTEGEASFWHGRLVRKSRKYSIRKWREDCWARIFALFREYNLQRLQGKQDELTEGEEMKQQQRMKITKGLTNKIRSRGRMDAENRWWVTELLAAGCEKAWIHPGWEDTIQEWYEWLKRMKKEDEKE